MKKLLFSFFILLSLHNFAQEKPTLLGFFSTVDVNIGLDLADIIRTNNATSEYELSQMPPGKFNYGMSAMVGFQPLKWFSISGGLRYSFIDPNYHLVYYKLQPQFYIGDHSEEDLTYLFFNFGSKINETAAQKAEFIGIGIGKMEPFSKSFGHQIQLSLNLQGIDNDANVFIGISYGIIIFSNKNL